MSQSGIEFTDPTIPAEALQQINYVSVAVAVVVLYDYVLTFPREVEYIWNKRWTRVSFLFIVVRYLGCCCALVAPFSRGTTLFSSETCKLIIKHHISAVQHTLGCALFALTQFAFILFLAAADLVMIFRVWAMYNRSRFILSILLLVYIPEVVLTTVVVVIANTPRNIIGITVLDRSICATALPLYHCMEDALIILIPAGVTCTLAIVQLVRELRQIHRTAKRWTLNRYMRLLSKESIAYFSAILFFGVVDVRSHPVILGSQTWFSFLSAISCAPVFTLSPRFILSLRALYARDPQNQSGIDTGFGFSEPSFNAGVGLTAMAFAEQAEDAHDGEEKQIEIGEYFWSDSC